MFLNAVVPLLSHLSDHLHNQNSFKRLASQLLQESRKILANAVLECNKDGERFQEAAAQVIEALLSSALDFSSEAETLWDIASKIGASGTMTSFTPVVLDRMSRTMAYTEYQQLFGRYPGSASMVVQVLQSHDRDTRLGALKCVGERTAAWSKHDDANSHPLLDAGLAAELFRKLGPWARESHEPRDEWTARFRILDVLAETQIWRDTISDEFHKMFLSTQPGARDQDDQREALYLIKRMYSLLRRIPSRPGPLPDSAKLRRVLLSSQAVSIVEASEELWDLRRSYMEAVHSYRTGTASGAVREGEQLETTGGPKAPRGGGTGATPSCDVEG